MSRHGLHGLDFRRGAYLHCGGRVHHPACGRPPSPGGAPRGTTDRRALLRLARRPGPNVGRAANSNFPDSAWHGKPRRRRRRSRARGVAPKANPRPEARLRGPGADFTRPRASCASYCFTVVVESATQQGASRQQLRPTSDRTTTLPVRQMFRARQQALVSLAQAFWPSA